MYMIAFLTESTQIHVLGSCWSQLVMTISGKSCQVVTRNGSWEAGQSSSFVEWLTLSHIKQFNYYDGLGLVVIRL